MKYCATSKENLYLRHVNESPLNDLRGFKSAARLSEFRLYDIENEGHSGLYQPADLEPRVAYKSLS
ncbi:hypothetical protein BCO18175_07402 [Burkholderia contaminans]|nr:hypothetical protein BCO18175_07402 [Burkholderia contaminans]